MHKTPNDIKKGLGTCSRNAPCSECPYKGLGCIDKMLLDAFELIQQLEAKVPRWISVEDDKPKEYENVNVYVAGDDGCRYTNTGFYDGKHWRGYGNRFDVVTHWTHLPEPPKED